MFSDYCDLSMCSEPVFSPKILFIDGHGAVSFLLPKHF